jgi:hypothetical protein
MIWLIPLALLAGFLWGWAAHLWWSEPPNGPPVENDAPLLNGQTYEDFIKSRNDAYAREHGAAHTHQVDF